MDMKIAKNLSKLIHEYGSSSGNYNVVTQMLKKGELQDFHRMADYRPCKGAFLISASSNTKLWVLVVAWDLKAPENFYLVVFPESKEAILAEIHNCRDDEGVLTLLWKYTPRKRDSKNKERQNYFEQAFNSKEVTISIPIVLIDVDSFFTELFTLAESRQKADDLDEIRPPSRDGFPEGRQIEKLHLKRERNPELIRQAKQGALRSNGKLECACCAFNFEDKYGKTGRDFIEGHHTKPISTYHDDGENTRVEDIALVCANCHRMLHRRRPWLEVDQLKNLVKETVN